MADRRAALFFAGIFALALGVRVAYLLQLGDSPLADVLLGDAARYHRWAAGIAAGDWWGSEVFYQAPFYPYLLGALYSLTGPEPLAARVLQIVLGSASCVLIALAGRRFFGASAGWIAGLGLALFAPAVYYDGLLQKASVALFLLSGVLCLLGAMSRRATAWRALAIGAMLGLLALTRENALVLLPVAALWFALGGPAAPSARRAGWVAALALGAGLVLVPVGLRNQALGDRFLITTAQLGPNFYIGNHENANGRYVSLRPGRGNVRFERLDATRLAEAAQGRELSPAEVSRHWLERGLGWMRAHPVEALRLLAWKAWLVLHAEEIVDTDSMGVYQDASPLLRVLGTLFHFGVLAPLAVLGLWSTRRRWRELWLLYGFAGGLAASLVMFYVLGRYRFPLVPLLAMFAGAGVIELARALRPPRVQPLAVAAALIAAVGLLSNWPLDVNRDARATTLYGLGLELRRAGRVAEAVDAFEDALRVDPRLAPVHVQLGELAHERGDDASAMESYRTALSNDPNSAGARVAVGTLFFDAGELGQAQVYYETALALDPENADAHNNLANLLLSRGRPGRARNHYRMARELRPDDATFLLNEAGALFREGDAPGALAAYDAAIGLEPGHPGAHYGRAIALERLRRNAEAAPDYLAVLESEDPRALRVRSESRIALARLLATCQEPEVRDPEKALVLARQAIKEMGKDASAEDFHALASAHAAMGRYIEAVMASERALALALESGEDGLARTLREHSKSFRDGVALQVRCTGSPAR